VDREPALVAAARERGIDARHCDFGQMLLPWPDGAFDAVVLAEVIEHVLDTDHMLTEIVRVLRSGGALVVTTPNLASLENRARLLLGRYPMWMDIRVEGTGHVRYYTPRMLRAHLRRHGFRVEQHVGNWVPFPPAAFPRTTAARRGSPSPATGSRRSRWGSHAGAPRPRRGARVTERPLVSTLILNWNGAHLLPDCLATLATQNWARTSRGVDNGSVDDSAAVTARYPARWLPMGRTSASPAPTTARCATPRASSSSS